MGLSPGDLIDDKYRIVRLLGEGGMGAVYEGENTRIHRRVAIKVLHQNVAGMADVVARFEREAQAAGRIGSEHIVDVLDLGTLLSGDRYMVMEYLDGDSFSARIRDRGRLSPGELYVIARQLLDALTAAHNAGIIHRDLKPDNVFLLKSRRGEPELVKLLDFGISKFSGSNAAFSMTRTGAVMGTPYYMAPEQARGARELDHRVDLYSVGVIFYEALAGQVPFKADTFNELLFKIVLETPAPLSDVVPNLDPAFAAIVSKAMAREPGERFQTADEFRQALESWAAGVSGLGAASVQTLNQAPLATRTGATPVGSPLGTTPGVWAGTSSPELKPVPKKSPVVAIAAAAAAVVLAGGAALAVFSSHGSSSGAAPDASSVEVAKSSPGPAAAPSAARAEADHPEPVVSPQGSASPAPAVSNPEPPALASVAPPPAKAAAAALEKPKLVQARAAPRPAAAAKPASDSVTSGGRKIRKTL
jgi:serine/threonine protein kinase